MAAFDEKEYTKPFNIMTWKKLFPFLKPYRFILLSIVILNLSVAFIDIIIPMFQRYAIDNFIILNTLNNVVPFTAIYFTTICISSISVIIFAKQSMFIEMSVGKDIKKALFVHLQTLSFSYYNVTPVGYILSRVMSDSSKIASLIAWSLIDLLWALSYVIGVFISMLILNAKLAVLVILIVPIIAVLTAYFQSKILFWNRKVRKINSRIMGAYNEGIVGVKTSKTMVIEDLNNRDFNDITENMHNASVKTAIINSIYIPLIMFFSSVATALVLARGGNMVISNSIDIGTLTVFTTYAVSIFEPIQQLARILADIISAQASIERVTDLLEKTPDITDTNQVIERYGDSFNPKVENWEDIKGDIEFKNVSFKYPDGDDYILENFNLKIPAGTNVAIVGETGAGKSTLVNLACRFFEPTSGQILIDGIDYKQRSQLWLHSNLGYVLQNPHLFSGTVRENIRYGRLDATDEDIEEAAKAVSADIVVAKLENGFDSDVGEGGDKLSTGEKQLISFARAVLADPKIFVLDEATSSIDTQTEQLIQKATEHILKDRTSFLIAHRLSTIRKADLILVVKDGKIIEQGTHIQLLNKKGYYSTLYNKQFEEEAAVLSWRKFDK